MQNKSLILHLIQQDMKHAQLINGLKNCGLNTDLHHLFLYESIARLMGIEEDIPDIWLDTYFGYLEKTSGYEIMELGENLEELARICYAALARSD